MSREAMQIALEALESDPVSHAGLVNRKQAINALRQALETEKQWQGLTDAEIHDMNGYEEDRRMYRFARAIEAKLKEKNT